MADTPEKDALFSSEDYANLATACEDARLRAAEDPAHRETWLRLLYGRMRAAALTPADDPSFATSLARIGRERGADFMSQLSLDREDYRGGRTLSSEEEESIAARLRSSYPDGAQLSPVERYAAIDEALLHADPANRKEAANLLLARRAAAREIARTPAEIVRLGAERPEYEQQFMTDLSPSGRLAEKFDTKSSRIVSDYMRGDADIVREMGQGNVMAAEALRARRAQASEELIASPRALFMLGRASAAPNAREDDPDFVAGRVRSDALERAGRNGWSAADVKGYENFKARLRDEMEAAFDDPVARYAELRLRAADAAVTRGKGRDEVYIHEFARESARVIQRDPVMVGRLMESHEDLEAAFVRDAQPDDGGRKAAAAARAPKTAAMPASGKTAEPEAPIVMGTEEEAEQKVISLFGAPGSKPNAKDGKRGGMKGEPRHVNPSDAAEVRPAVQKVLKSTPSEIGQVVDILRKGGDGILPLSLNSSMDAAVLAKQVARLVRDNPQAARDVYINTCMTRESLLHNGRPINDEAAMCVKRLELGRRVMAEPIGKLNMKLGGHRPLKPNEMNALAAYHGDTEIGSYSRCDITREINSGLVRDMQTLKAHFEPRNLNRTFFSLAISGFGASGLVNREIASLMKADPQRVVEMYKNTVSKRGSLLETAPLDPEAQLAHDRLEMGRRALGGMLVRKGWLSKEMAESDRREFMSDVARQLPKEFKRERIESEKPSPMEIEQAKERGRRPFKKAQGVVDMLASEISQHAR